MNVNIEIFDNDAIENIVTCLNFKMDRVIFFGQEDVMTPEAQKTTKALLQEHCGITNVDCRILSMKDIDAVFSSVTKAVEQEVAKGGKCFFDLTGGSDMVMVAMGMYSATHNIPMHRYDIDDGQLQVINLDAAHIDQCVPKREVKLTIEDLVKIQGGKVASGMQKGSKDGLTDPDVKSDLYALWRIAGKNMRRWSEFSSILNATKTSKYQTFDPTVNLVEWMEREKVQNLVKNKSLISSEQDFLAYLEQLETAGCISKLISHGDWISFSYSTNHIRSWMLDAGSLLELHTYFERLDSGLYDECKIGTHLKWGVVPEEDGYMVNNEIDVLLRRGYVMTFISCKAGKPDQMALYELDTVAYRFGGKYAKKELVTAGYIESHHAQRAKEMGISVLQV